MSLQTTLGSTNQLQAGEALTSKQYYIGQLDASGNLEVAESATDLIVGVILTEAASGEMAQYQFAGVAKVISDGTPAIGDFVTTDASGKATPTTTDGNVVIGRALTAAAADGDYILVQLALGTVYVA